MEPNTPGKGPVNYIQPDDVIYLITVFSAPDEPLKTNKGYIPYREWLEKEKARTKGYPTRIETDPVTGHVALAVIRTTKLSKPVR